MKKIILAFVFPFLFVHLQAQVKFGLKAGLNTYEINETLNFAAFDSPQDQFTYAVENTNWGYHFGLYGQLNIGPFIVQPEVLFNSDNVDFKLTNADDPANVERVIKQRYQNLDIPLLIKFKLGPARLMAGPVGHLFISNNSDFADAVLNDPIEDQFELGFQAGIGLAFWKLHLDLKYEGNFNKFGDEIVIYGTELEFSKNDQRLILSLGYEF